MTDPKRLLSLERRVASVERQSGLWEKAKGVFKKEVKVEDRRPGETWETEKGHGAKSMDGEVRYFSDKGLAQQFAKWKGKEEKPTKPEKWTPPKDYDYKLRKKYRAYDDEQLEAYLPKFKEEWENSKGTDREDQEKYDYEWLKAEVANRKKRKTPEYKSEKRTKEIKDLVSRIDNDERNFPRQFGQAWDDHRDKIRGNRKLLRKLREEALKEGDTIEISDKEIKRAEDRIKGLEHGIKEEERDIKTTESQLEGKPGARSLGYESHGEKRERLKKMKVELKKMQDSLKERQEEVKYLKDMKQKTEKLPKAASARIYLLAEWLRIP